MVKRLSFLAAAAALVFAVPSQVEAQTTLYLGAGGGFPSGDFSEYAKTGFLGVGGVLFNIPSVQGLGAGVEGFYGSFSHEDYNIETTISKVANFSAVAGTADSDKTDIYGVMGILDYVFDTGGALEPYLFGGLGLLVHKYSTDIEGLSESKSYFGYEFGAGLGYRVSESISIFGEGRFMGATDTKLWGLLAGLAFQL